MKRISLLFLALAFGLLAGSSVRAEDPFAAGEDALAVSEADGSGSLRAKLALKKMEDDMIMVKVTAVDDKEFPRCILHAQVVKDARTKEKALKLIGKGKTYRFAPVLKAPAKCAKAKGKAACGKADIDLTDQATQSNLGACYYPAKTKLIIRVGNVDMGAKIFEATEIYLND